MPHIEFNNQMPGILGPMHYKPETAKALNNLAQTLLHGASQLTKAERELIAAFVSRKNNCLFCTESHAAVARAHAPNTSQEVDEVLLHGPTAASSKKMNALLKIAELVARHGQEVHENAIHDARAAGASDEDIHDTVLIAAAFCMFNRYVDGLRTTQPPRGSQVYKDIGERLTHGYSAV